MSKTSTKPATAASSKSSDKSEKTTRDSNGTNENITANPQATGTHGVHAASSLVPQMINTTEDMFVNDLRDMYWAELHLVKALPKMAGAASGTDLKAALEEHLDVTLIQVSRLEQVFELAGIPNIAKKCDALEGLVISGEQVIENTRTGSDMRDTGIIGSGLKVENFEITCYKGLIQLADKLGYTDAVELLTENLREEEEASDTLNTLAAQSN
ncbi:MAG: DUF892 family protein [Chitinophagaceae bacterium]